MMRNENQVRWVPSDYATSSTGQSTWARELLSHVSLKGDEVILDVGCGNGQITAELSRCVPQGRVIGIDASPEMIEFARKAFPQRHFPNLEFLTRDGQAIVTGDGSAAIGPCDLAFSNAALHWMHDQPAVLRGLHQVLRPGGRLIVSAGGRGNAAGMIEVMNAVMSRSEWREFFVEFRFPWQFSGADEFREWLIAAGFYVQRVELVPKQMPHNRTSLTAWLRTTWMPYWQRVPTNRSAAFLSEVVDEYARRFPPDSDGKLAVSMVRLEVEATA